MQKQISLFIVFFLSILICSPLSAREVYGIVSDQSTGEPIAGALVWIYESGDSVRTNGLGEYYFANITDGNYTVISGGENYVPKILGSVTISGYICGDVNADVDINILDITYLIAFLYLSGPAPNSSENADVDNSGAINILDITYLISFLYQDGPEPVCQ